MAMRSDFNNSIMRTVSFVERIEIEYRGNVISQAMVLADVDNDSANELIVGNIEGDIAIFKGDSSTAWKKTVVSGMLTCLAVGEIHVPHKNSLVCMSAEGFCYVYDIAAHSFIQNASGTDDESDKYIKPVFTQELPANARVMCLADIDSDGCVEMVIGYSDRVVRAFQWHEPHNGDESGHFVLLQKWQLAGQIGSITINYDKYRNPELMVSQPGATFVSLRVKPHLRHIKSESCLEKLGTVKLSTVLGRSGSFAASGTEDSSIVAFKQSLKGHGNTFKSDGLCSTSGNSSNQSVETTSVVSLDSCSQPAAVRKPEATKSSEDASERNVTDKIAEDSLVNSTMQLSMDNLDGQASKKSSNHVEGSESVFKDSTTPLDGSFDDEVFIIYHPLAHSQTRNKDTSTVIVGGINRGRSSTSDEDSSQATYYALATLDGSLILVENDNILWSLQVDHYLFALSKLDVTGNGKEEVVCCSWSGQTYIVNHSKEIVRYQFPDSVAAFCAGHFAAQGRMNVPCFVYATFNNRIYIYPNIPLPRVESTNLYKMMGRLPEAQELLHKLNIDAEDVEVVRKLYHWCLYGQPRKS